MPESQENTKSMPKATGGLGGADLMDQIRNAKLKKSESVINPNPPKPSGPPKLDMMAEMLNKGKQLKKSPSAIGNPKEGIPKPPSVNLSAPKMPARDSVSPKVAPTNPNSQPKMPPRDSNPKAAPSSQPKMPPRDSTPAPPPDNNTTTTTTTTSDDQMPDFASQLDPNLPPWKAKLELKKLEDKWLQGQPERDLQKKKDEWNKIPDWKRKVLENQGKRPF